MSQRRNNKAAILSLWIVGFAVASFAVMPSLAFASNSGESGKCNTCSNGKTGADKGGTVDTQTYQSVKTKTTTTDIHKQITKKEIVGTKTTITTKVSEGESGDNGDAAIAAATANGTSISGGECNCDDNSNDQSDQDNGDQGS